MTIRSEKAVLQVSFSKEKLEALKFYLGEKDSTIEKELQDHVKGVYEKYVPAPTRRYLDRNDSAVEEQAEVSEETSDIQQETVPAAPPVRGRRRNAREQTADVNESENVSLTGENSEQSEQESQGMSMSM